MSIFVSMLLTVVGGFLAAGTIGNAMNWPDAGAVFAVAIMGACILAELRRKNKKKDEE